jgi:hypothetical protein
MNLKLLLAVSICITFGCSSKKDDASVSEAEIINSLSAALAEAGVSSPTAKKSSTTPGASGIIGSFVETTQEQVLTAAEQIAAIEDQSQKATIAKCFEGINLDVGLQETNLACFGPDVQISGASYPFDSSVNTGTGTGADSFQNAQAPNGTAPKGDLGIWNSAETSGEACISAKMNTLVNDASKTVFVAEKLFAAILCVAHHSSVALPAAGASVDLLSLVSGKLTGVTFGTASLSRAASDTVGSVTYSMTVGGSIGAGAFSLTSNTTKSDTTVSGRIYGYKPNVGPNGQSSEAAIFSVVYNQTSTSHKVMMKAAVASSTTGAFDSDHDLSFNTVSGNNYYYIISDIDPATNLGKLHMAWQAGGGDSNTRVFRVETSSSGGVDTGFGYFGFGDKINTGTPGLGIIDGMICNWAITKGGLFDHVTHFKASKVQSQKIQRNASGVFVSTEDKISYAPTFTCNNNPISGSAIGDFSVTILSGSPPNQTLTTDVKNFATNFVNDLVTLGSGGYTDVGAITAPTYP